jgi:hypothetical protein
MRDSPAFLNLILDFTITSPSLSTEYKVNLQPHICPAFPPVSSQAIMYSFIKCLT